MNNYEQMRKALRALRDASRDFYNQILNSKYSEILDKYTCVKQGFPAVLDLRSTFPMANHALSAPPRQCDVGTPYEQANRMRQFCAEQKRDGMRSCAYCPIAKPFTLDCALIWAQMPYAEEGGQS